VGVGKGIAVVLKQWMRQPQTLWVRRALFQVHLWCGLAIGLYLVVLSVTGSVLVYRNEIGAYVATPKPPFDPNAKLLSKEEMQQAVERAYPGWTVSQLGTRVNRRSPTFSATVELGEQKKDRLFNPYTGADLGDAFTQGEWALLKLVELHDDLLFDRTGRFWNGVGSGIMTIICLTGIVVWWPGMARWTRSLWVRWRSGWRAFNWDLHSALGFWMFLFLLMWAVSGLYLGIPEPFSRFVDWVSDPNATERTGDTVLLWLTRLHFGRWRNMPWLKAAWAVLGLIPAAMVVTGAIMWWNRVVRRRNVTPSS
jgi:uncharacterized iron-regulated membrane protein